MVASDNCAPRKKSTDIVIMLWRRITTYSFPAALAAYYFGDTWHPLVIDSIRAVAFLVGTAALFFLLTVSHKTLVLSYKTWFPDLTYNLRWILITNLHNAVVHFLPILLLGTPKTWRGFLVGYVVVIMWFLNIRTQINGLYVPGIKVLHYVVGIFVIPVLVWLLLNWTWLNQRVKRLILVH